MGRLFPKGPFWSSVILEFNIEKRFKRGPLHRKPKYTPLKTKGGEDRKEDRNRVPDKFSKRGAPEMVGETRGA